MVVGFTIPGRPIPKARPRVTRYATYTPQSTKDFEERILFSYKAGHFPMFPADTPLSMSVMAWFPIPSSLSKKKQAQLEGKPHIKRGDLDNVVKAILDGLNGVAYPDDSAVWTITAAKGYSSEPRTVVTIWNESEDAFA